uniref:Gustatory receptor n=2 Tax=Tribolium castaneum TaxID=7070 RepID=A2AXA6_TRICA|nr:gustatory receptor [Tribolium castaneum]CAL23177.1 gustatory receptor candidate 44 [Tribolium castaneum]
MTRAMVRPELDLNSLKCITKVLTILGLLSCSFPKKKLVYCIIFGAIATLTCIEGLRDCPRKYSTPLAKITTILQRYCSVLLVFLTYFFNILFRKKLLNAVKILSKIDETLNSKPLKPVKIRTKVYLVYCSSALVLAAMTTFHLIYEAHGFSYKCGIQYHICNTVISATVCFMMLLMLEIWRRFTILNNYLTIVLGETWTSLSVYHLVEISEIHFDLCQAADDLNRYFEVQVLTIFGVSFYFFISTFFYFFTTGNIIATYDKQFYIHNALIVRALFLFFQLWATVYTSSQVTREVQSRSNRMTPLKLQPQNFSI